jgi:hypothetical protein
MDRTSLLEAIEREGIRARTYDLIGGNDRTECLCLGICGGGWSVWYAERGLRTGERFFDTEDEACSYMLIRLVGDPNTRVG